jgi:hypothetical protein
MVYWYSSIYATAVFQRRGEEEEATEGETAQLPPPQLESKEFVL